MEPPSLVDQTPPFTAPMNIRLGLFGSIAIAWMAPTDVPLGGASMLCTKGDEPNIGEGPCGKNVCAAATVVQTMMANAAKGASALDAYSPYEPSAGGSACSIMDSRAFPMIAYLDSTALLPKR